jgi:hypothetical protein
VEPPDEKVVCAVDATAFTAPEVVLTIEYRLLVNSAGNLGKHLRCRNG